MRSQGEFAQEQVLMDFGSLVPDPDEESKVKEYRVWAIQPVTILEFVENYIGIRTLSKAQLHILHDIFGDDPENTFFNVEQAILKIGQGGGKNLVSNIAIVYSFYLWCCLSDPHRYFDQQRHESFDVLNFSQVNEKQARNVFFKSLTNMMKNVKDPITGNNWFTQHMGFQIKQYGRGDVKEKELSIPNRNPDLPGIIVYCLDSEAEKVEGYKTWLFILDEPSRANTPVKYAKAKKQYKTCYTNNKTRFPMHHRLGIIFAYPEQEVNDLLVELFDLYSLAPSENKQEINEGVLTAWYDTYVFNPKWTKQDYLIEHEKDPVDADRRWRAIVPPNEFGFFMPYMGKIQECANPNLPEPIKYKKSITRRKAKVEGVIKMVDFTGLELYEINADERERWWGGDFAVSKDRLVLAGGYNERLKKPIKDFIVRERDKITGEEIEKTIVIESRPVVDIILIWEPSKNNPIDYQNVEDVIMDIFENIFPNSKGLHFDKFNTENIKQKLLDIGIYNCETLTFSNPEQLRLGRIFRHLVWNNACEYLKIDLLIREMSRLLLLNNIKLDHPGGAHESKDIWDAVSICMNLLVEHAGESRALDVDMGVGIDMKKEDTDLIKVYDKSFKDFVNEYGRSPEDNKEMADYMFKKFGVRKSPSQIEYMRQSWLIYVDEQHERVLGLSHFMQSEEDRMNIDIGIDIEDMGIDIF